MVGTSTLITLVVAAEVSLFYGLRFTVATGCSRAVASDIDTDATAGQRHFLFALSGLVAFSAGGSQVGLAVGLLLPLRDTVSIPLVWILVGANELAQPPSVTQL